MTRRSADLLGVYILPGPAMNPLPALLQTTEAERIGLGSAWMSELQGPFKDAGALCGYMGATTSRIGVGTSITHFGTRHPIVLSSWAATMQVMTGGRFLFGFGRSTPQRWKAWGLPVPTIESMGDYATILRRLWSGETFEYHGAAGDYPRLSWDANGGDFDHFTPPPLMIAAIGPKTLALAGSHFDAVLLHPFLTPEAVTRSAALVRQSAEQAGKDPASVKVYHQIVIAPDLSPEATDEAVYKRAAAYFAHPGFGEPILAANGFDVARLTEYRAAADLAVKENIAAGSPLKGRDVYLEPSRLLPPEIIGQGASIGTAQECAVRLHDYFDAGADEIVLHGVTADQLESTVNAFTAHG
ncbi:MAG: putative Coenzyme F420-dependent N(10)-methylenetetrahydromethanopterin reductase [Ilumatobacteraceae bacterium]|nr:putative Coenzyme F420-dependent N(10)-methylenetetrahydromethanopterin reductase [Ilumatobacteraceae bacterium]